MKNEKFYDCEKCKYAKIIRKHWQAEYKGKIATVIVRTITATLLVQTIIIAIMKKFI